MKLNQFDDLNSSFSAVGDNFYGGYGAGGDYSQYYYPGAGGAYYNYKGYGAGGDNFLVVMVLVVITTSTIVTSDDFILTVHYKLQEFIRREEMGLQSCIGFQLSVFDLSLHARKSACTVSLEVSGEFMNESGN